MIRLFFVGVAIFIFFIPLGIPVMLLCWALGCISPVAKDYVALYYMKALMWVLCLCTGVKINAVGLENIPGDKPVLYISNHRSYIDIFVAYQFIKKPCGTVAKLEWNRIPLLRDWMVLLHCFFLDRKSARAGLVVTHQIIAELEKGNSYWIYPEGTRNHEDRMLPFKEGSFRAAFQTGAPIIPVTFTHTDDVYELHRPFVKPAAVTVHFGKPVATEGLDRPAQKEVCHKVAEQIQYTYDLLV